MNHLSFIFDAIVDYNTFESNRSLKQRAVKLQVHGDEIDAHIDRQNYESTRSMTAIEVVTVPPVTSTPLVATTGEMILTQRKVQTPPLSARRSSEEIYKTSTPDIPEHEIRNYTTGKHTGTNAYGKTYPNPTHVSPIGIRLQSIMIQFVSKTLPA